MWFYMEWFFGTYHTGISSYLASQTDWQVVCQVSIFLEHSNHTYPRQNHSLDLLQITTKNETKSLFLQCWKKRQHETNIIFLYRNLLKPRSTYRRDVSQQHEVTLIVNNLTWQHLNNKDCFLDHKKQQLFIEVQRLPNTRKCSSEWMIVRQFSCRTRQQ